MARFILSLAALERNACVLREVAQRSGAHMLLALKAFSTTAFSQRGRWKPDLERYFSSSSRGTSGEFSLLAPTRSSTALVFSL